MMNVFGITDQGIRVLLLLASIGMSAGMWLGFMIAGSGAWSERVMPKRAIEQHFKMAVVTSIIGVILFILL
jgi:hypothetical protein